MIINIMTVITTVGVVVVVINIVVAMTSVGITVIIPCSFSVEAHPEADLVERAELPETQEMISGNQAWAFDSHFI